MNGEVTFGCLIEAVMVCNANTDGLEVEAAQYLKKKFEDADNPLGSAALTKVTCNRCESVFFIDETVPGRRGAVCFASAGAGGKTCDLPTGIKTGTPGDKLLNIDLSNIA